MEAPKLEIVENNENLESIDTTKEIILQNGDKILVHAETGFDDLYPNGRSFDDVPGTGDRIRFTHHVRLHRDGIRQLTEAGGQIRSNPTMVHHQHVNWLYQLGVEAFEKGVCSLRIDSLGPSFKPKATLPRGAFSINIPIRQTPPSSEMTCTLLLEEGGEKPIPMKKEGDGYKSKTTFPLEMLNKTVNKNSIARIRVEIVIPRDYFQLETIMDPNLEEPEKVLEAAQLLEVVIKGEKPVGWDWVITTGDGKNFFVHGKVLAHSSPLLEVAMRTHSSAGRQQNILMISHENRFILPQVTYTDMPIILAYFYLRKFILPPFDVITRLGRIFCTLLPPNAIGIMFAFWEKAIIKEVLYLERKKETIPKLARSLIALYSSPYGAMPAAKKVLISKMADVWHMAETTGEDPTVIYKDEPIFRYDVLQHAQSAVSRFIIVAASIQKEYI